MWEDGRCVCVGGGAGGRMAGVVGGRCGGAGKCGWVGTGGKGVWVSVGEGGAGGKDVYICVIITVTITISTNCRL